VIATDPAADGWVVRVDIPNRELTVLSKGHVLEFDVPPGCAIVMNGQPVRLRLLQTEDRVRVRYETGAQRGVAVRIEVNPTSAPVERGAAGDREMNFRSPAALRSTG
jgi:hypothetical protein